ncbi:myb-like protein X [Saccostrea cucullata]|uniref:myb-like protein X n=1 Tax=Saccostrea cuccullata TaxID=36930 RepID=UPI002ED4E8B7
MKTMDYNEVLDFGDGPVTDVDTKLEILKFSYNWADAVEEEERRMEEEQKQQKEMKKKMEKEISGEEKKDCNKNHKRMNTMDYNEILDFGENPVTDVDTKLEILKFSYNWSDAVEEEERRMEEGQKQQNGMKNLEKEIGGEEKRNCYKNHNRKQPEKINRKQHRARKHAKVHIIKQQKLRLETAESTKQMIERENRKASGDELTPIVETSKQVTVCETNILGEKKTADLSAENFTICDENVSRKKSPACNEEMSEKKPNNCCEMTGLNSIPCDKEFFEEKATLYDKVLSEKISPANNEEMSGEKKIAHKKMSEENTTVREKISGEKITPHEEMAEEKKIAHVEMSEEKKTAHVQMTEEKETAHVEMSEEKKTALVEIPEEKETVHVEMSEEKITAHEEMTEEKKTALVEMTEEKKTAHV